MTTTQPVSAENERTKREQLRRREIHLSILTAAENIILAKGFTAMTMDDIAAEACLSKATLYKYIPSKERILFEIASRHLHEWEELIEHASTAPVGAAEKLRRIIADSIQVHRKKRNINRMLMLDETTLKFIRRIFESETKAEKGQFEENMAFLKRKNLEILQRIAGVIATGVAAGEFRPVDPMETVFFLNSILCGINHNWFWKSGVIDLPEEELAERSFQFIHSSIIRREATPAGTETVTGTSTGDERSQTNA